MILDTEAFESLENLVNSNPSIEYVVLNFDFTQEGINIRFDKQFIPIHDINFFHTKKLENILNLTLSVVIYDKGRFENNLKEFLLDIVLDVLERRVSQSTLLVLDENFSTLDFSDSSLLKDNSLLLKIISDTLFALKLTKDIKKELSLLDKNFLNEEQRLQIVQTYTPTKKQQVESFNEDEYIRLNDEDKLSYIENIYKEIDESYIPMLEISEKNIKKILKDLKLKKNINKLFFNEDDISIFEYEMLDNDKIYTLIYEELAQCNTKLYQNAKNYFLEIQREVKYLNLYQLDSLYNQHQHVGALQKLYESMTYNALSDIVIKKTIEDFYSLVDKQHEQLQKGLKKIRQKHAKIMFKECYKYFHGDIKSYEEQLTSDYMNLIYGADKYGVSIEDVLDYNTREDIKDYMQIYFYDTYHLEMALIEQYLTNTHKNITPEIEETLKKSIPATKTVGKAKKRKRLTIKEREKLLKAKKKEYIENLKISTKTQRESQYQQYNESTFHYKNSIEDFLDYKINLVDITSEFFDDAYQRGLDKWSASEEDTPCNEYIQQKSQEIKDVRDKFKSTTAEILKEQKDQNPIFKKDSKLTKKQMKF